MSHPTKAKIETEGVRMFQTFIQFLSLGSADE